MTYCALILSVEVGFKMNGNICKLLGELSVIKEENMIIQQFEVTTSYKYTNNASITQHHRSGLNPNRSSVFNMDTWEVKLSGSRLIG